MRVKRGILASLLAVLAIGASGRVHALPAADWQPGRDPILNVYFGGSTSVDNTLERFFLISATGGICSNDVTNGNPATTTIDIYRVLFVQSKQTVIFCRVRAGIRGLAAGRPVAFHKESMGGSSNGIVPHIDPTPNNGVDNRPQLPFYNMSNAGTCTQIDAIPSTSGTIDVFTGVGLIPWREWNCERSVVNQYVDGGVSDTEGNLAFPPPDLTQLRQQVMQDSGFGITFGIPVSLNLYRALQRAQGLATDDTQANVPSLASSQIRGLYAGGFVDWNAITSSAGVPLADVPGNNPVNTAAGGAADSNVFVCRRVATSGTQASFEAFWLQQRCESESASASPASFVPPDDGSTSSQGLPPNAAIGFVNSSESSADMRACLNYHNVNGTWAVGMLSTEVTAGDLSSGGFRFVRVDGKLPNLASVGNGDYEFFTENVFTRRWSFVPNHPTGTVLSLLEQIESNARTPSVLALTNIGFRDRPWGDGGMLARPVRLAVPNPPPQIDGGLAIAGSMRANPVNTQIRSYLGGIINNCVSPVMIFPSPAP